MDTMDAATPARRPADEFMLESVNTAGICKYADIGDMALVVNVNKKVSF